MRDPIGDVYLKRTERMIKQACAADYYKPSLRFRASELTSCPRQIFHRLMGERPQPRTARGQDYGDGGDAAHDILRQALKDEGYEIGGIEFNDTGQVETKSHVGEFEFKDETIKVACRLDGLIDHDGKDAVFEGKSVGYWKYKRMVQAYDSGGADRLLQHIEKHHLSYLWQCQANMQIFDKPWAWLVIYDRSECRMGIHPNRDGMEIVGGLWLPRDDELWNDTILPKLYRIQRAVKKQAALRPAELPGSQACDWCAFSHCCHDAIQRRQQGLEPAVLYPWKLEGEDAG